jgi:hypothetical protein
LGPVDGARGRKIAVFGAQGLQAHLRRQRGDLAVDV